MSPAFERCPLIGLGVAVLVVGPPETATLNIMPGLNSTASIKVRRRRETVTGE